MSHKPIDDIAESETRLFLTTEAFRFIECAINLAVHTAPIETVVAYLRKLADQLEDYG